MNICRYNSTSWFKVSTDIKVQPHELALSLFCWAFWSTREQEKQVPLLLSFYTHLLSFLFISLSLFYFRILPSFGAPIRLWTPACTYIWANLLSHYPILVWQWLGLCVANAKPSLPPLIQHKYNAVNPRVKRTQAKGSPSSQAFLGKKCAPCEQ